ncbi:MAG: 30S ribosomal protein S6 [Candidatus Taylorbacteria bacterium]|nr:30S ribosomal protein S6 [Candidatus Taylorbacteria bacterium]
MTEKIQVEQAENRIYELGYLVVSSIPEEKLPAEVTIIKDLLETNGAVFVSEESPRLKPLAYQMTKIVGPKHLKFDTAYFGWVKFEMNPVSVEVVKKTLERNDSVIRFILVKTVRENTMSVIKAPNYRSEEKSIPGIGTDAKKEVVVKSPMTEAELDKTIEQLIVE